MRAVSSCVTGRPSRAGVEYLAMYLLIVSSESALSPIAFWKPVGKVIKLACLLGVSIL